MAKAPVMLVLAIGLMLRCAHSAKPPTPADTGRRAQNEDVYHVALFRIPKEHLKEATSAFREMAVAARRERGAIQYDVFRGLKSEQDFYIVEHWASPAALEAHEHTQAFLRLGKGVLEKYATVHEALTAQAFDVAKLALPDQ